MHVKIFLAVPLTILFFAGCSGFVKPGSTPPISGPASIVVQPANRSVTIGQSASFGVTAGGAAPLSYQWRKNGNPTAGATLPTFITPATTSADNGARFDVMVSNPLGTAISTQASLTVTTAAPPTAPSISSQPSNVSVAPGQTATFSVTAGGTAPLTYQWQKNTANISGATLAAYTTPATTSADNGEQYRVMVSNGTGSATSNSATLTVTSSTLAPAITGQPNNETVTAGQVASFNVTATGSPAPSYQWKKNGSNISGATSAKYTTPATVAGDSGGSFDVVVSNSAGSATSHAATLTVNAVTPPPTSVDVVTYHYDNLRTGQNVNETTLTHANVNSSKFGKLGSFSVDGKVDGQPLYLSNVSIPGKGNKNVLYVVTEHDSIYAFDADGVNGSSSNVLWKVSALKSGESSSDDRGCGQVTPEIGITSTPVIDRSRNAIYLVSVSKDGNGNYFHRIHALNLTNGSELMGGPTTISATYPGSGANSSNGNVVFDASAYNERAGLLEIGGTIYTSWGSHCDAGSYTSWVMSYGADTLHQTGVLNLVPNGNEGGIWMAGAAPAADASGNIYLIVGNGDFDTSLNGSGFPANGNCGNCYVKISSALKLLDYFTPQNTVSESGADTDFGSGGPLLLPDLKDGQGNTRHLAVGSGKDANIYVVDRDNMGKFHSGSDNIYQQLNSQLGGGMWAKPSYFNGMVYYGAVNDVVKAFQLTSGKLSSAPSSQGAHQFGYPGTTPSISANGTSNGIVWAVENASPAVLHAYDAINVGNELYNSNQASNGRDNFSGNKYITAVVVNGKVYVATPNSVAVFGLLP
jgi:hypothetical protein